ncbi:hypothetical protein [Stenotrophomonas sp. YIM B06876]|uniref:hypothetical protein n=1 Tax=Stenotrophomonas sp. YIM B06876 TaxID=3060211 RepID=UPI002738DAB0|nr:hypothetical protein [Stenotrophomonas sp. YIM B06876]
MKKLLAIALLCLLSACSQGIKGVYADDMGATRYTFQSDGRLGIEVMGVQQYASYTRDGDRLEIALAGHGASLGFTINPDGSLTGPMGVRLRKHKD